MSRLEGRIFTLISGQKGLSNENIDVTGGCRKSFFLFKHVLWSLCQWRIKTSGCRLKRPERQMLSLLNVLNTVSYIGWNISANFVIRQSCNGNFWKQVTLSFHFVRCFLFLIPGMKTFLVPFVVPFLKRFCVVWKSNVWKWKVVCRALASTETELPRSQSRFEYRQRPGNEVARWFSLTREIDTKQSR